MRIIEPTPKRMNALVAQYREDCTPVLKSNKRQATCTSALPEIFLYGCILQPSQAGVRCKPPTGSSAAPRSHNTQQQHTLPLKVLELAD